jgi:hypothetical protein
MTGTDIVIAIHGKLKCLQANARVLLQNMINYFGEIPGYLS